MALQPLPLSLHPPASERGQIQGWAGQAISPSVLLQHDLSSPTADDSSGFLLLATHLEIFVLSLREFSIASTGDVKKVALSPSVHLIV
jgi:hypothetical protein